MSQVFLDATIYGSIDNISTWKNTLSAKRFTSQYEKDQNILKQS